MNRHWFEDLAEQMGPAYLRYGFTRGTAQEVAFLVEALDLRPGERVLDLGCGPGRHMAELSGAGYRALGVDISRRFLQIGAATTKDAGWVRADAGRLPLAEASVDAVISLCGGAFGMPRPGVDEDPAILAEVARVLRPGGRMALTAFSAYFQVRWLEDSDSFDVDAGINHEHTQIHDESGHKLPAELWSACYTPRELRLLVREVGLKVEAVWSVAPGRYARRSPDLAHQELLVLARR